MNLEPRPGPGRPRPQGTVSAWVAVFFAILSVLAILADLLAIIQNETRPAEATTVASGHPARHHHRPTTTTTVQPTTTQTNVVVPGPVPPPTVPVVSGGYPATPAASGGLMCGQAILNSPYNSGNQPALGTTTSVVVIPPGSNTGSYNVSNTTYYFAPGAHTAAVSMGVNDWYVGQYSGGVGATVNGGGAQYGFLTLQSAPADFVEYMTITGYTTYAVGFGYNTVAPYPTGAPGNLTLKYSTVTGNYPGSGMDAGSYDVVDDNCFTNNGDYGIQNFCQVNSACVHPSTLTNGPLDITIQNNEVSYNDACNWEAAPLAYFPITVPGACGSVGYSGCGCAGGLHFWNVDGSKVVGNYVHDNYDVAAWWDTDDNAEYVYGNYFSNNWTEAIDMEISYNAFISNNNFVNNAWALGACGNAAGNPCNISGNLAAAIYDSESGGTGTGIGESSWPTGTPITTFTVSANNFTNNWDGVMSFDYPDRFSGSPDNTSTYWGTMGLPTSSFTAFWDGVSTDVPTTPYYPNYGATGTGCGQAKLTGAVPTGSPSPAYWDNCWWKISQLSVTGNSFSLNASAITGLGTTGSTIVCSTSTGAYCGMNAVWQQAGSLSWSPYLTFAGGYGMWGEMDNCVPAYTFTGCVSLDNSYTNNTYTHTGSQQWRFLFYNGVVQTPSQWQLDGWDGGSSFT